MSQLNYISELQKCSNDPVYFIEKYVKIQHPTKGTLPFRLYDFQKESIEDFVEHRFNIVLKSRQLGYSTVTAAFCLWAAIFNSDKAIVVVATELRTATNFFKKVAFAWNKLPAFFKKFVTPTTMTKQEIAFDNGSFVKAIPTGDSAGRSEALSMLIVDEAAFIDGFEELYSQVYPTLSTGGRCVILSTPGPIGNKYHQIWVSAEKRENEFNPIKLPWNVHPDRDEKWYKQTYRNMGHAKFEREYNCSFEGASDNFFKPEIVEATEEKIELPIDVADKETWIWEHPREGASYVLAADVARGDGGDYSTMYIVDVQTGDIVLEDRRHESPREYGMRAVRWAKIYNNALIAPESNTFGFMMISAIRDIGYLNVYFQRIANWRAAQDGDFLPERAGFSMQSESRNAALIRLEEFLDTGFFVIRSQRFLEEMKSFIMRPTKTGAMKPAALKGKHDDLIICLAIAASVIYQVNNGPHSEMLKNKPDSAKDMNIMKALERSRGINKSSILSAVGERGIQSLRPNTANAKQGQDEELLKFLKAVMR